MKKLFILSLIVGLALSSCTKEHLIDVTGKLTGKVYDQYNNPIEKALITVEGTDLKDSTKADGSYSISGISLGTHFVSISKSGYTIYRYTINVQSPIDEAVSKKSQSLEVSVVLDGKLYTLTGQTKGYVTYNGNAVSNAKVVAYWMGNSAGGTQTFSTTTDANGMFSFTALPLIDYVNGSYYSERISIVAYDPQNPDFSATHDLSNTAFVRSMQYDLSHDALQLISYTGMDYTSRVDTLAANAAITLTFNQSVSQAITLKYENGEDISLRTGTSYNSPKIAATVTYNNNKITITPSGNLAPSTTYYLYGTVYATAYKSSSLEGNYSFTTIARPAKAMTVKPVLTITTVSGTKYLKLTTTTSNASGYELYASKDGIADYVQISSSYVDLYTLTSSTNGQSLSAYPYSNYTKFYIIPYNSNTGGTKVYGTASDVVTE